MISKHWTEDRKARIHTINMIGEGQIIKRVIVDKGHVNGPEIHEISTTGIITVKNLRTKKLVTKLIARPGQIKRYWTDGNAPAELIRIAREHQQAGLNKR